MTVKKLKPSTKIDMIVDGFAFTCLVRDIRSQSGLDCVEEINRILASGEVMTGFVGRFGGRNIQINWG